MIVTPSRITLILALLVLSLSAPAVMGSVAGRQPRPCLVPPVPQKKSLPPPLGGAADPGRVFSGYSRESLAPRSTGPDGRIRVLAIRVDFEQEPMDSTTAYFERLLLFLTEHYDVTSGGKARIEATLAPSVYRMPESLEFYGLDDSIGVRQALLCYDAVQAADPEVDFEEYDQVLMFHAGPGQESDVLDDSREQVWSVFFRLDDFAYYLPRPFAERGIMTGDRTADGDTVFVTSLAVTPELESQDGFVFSPVGVLCHEFGHSFGLPDLYDTVAPENQVYAESQGIGSWDLMSAGTWNANGFVPAEFSAWSKVFAGWIDPVVVTTDTDITLQAVGLDRDRGVIKVPISGDEYFLIENRLQDLNGDGTFNFTENDSSGCAWQPVAGTQDSTLVCLFDFYEDSYADAEWDYWLPGEGTGSGLLIWHIDESVIADNLPYNTVNAEAAQKGIDLEEADGIQDMDLLGGDSDAFGSPYDTYRAGWFDRFGPDTEPNSDAYFGIETGITIDQVSAVGPTMTFRIRFAADDDRWPLALAAPAGANHVATGNLDGDGEREIAVADRAGHVYVLDPDGLPAWGGEAGSWFIDLETPLGAPLVADLDGDGQPDLLVPADDGRIFGFAGPDGRRLGVDGSGLLVESTNPMPGVELWSCDLSPDLPGLEFGFGGALQEETGLSRVEIFGVSVDGRAIRRGVASLHGGTGALPCVVADVDGDGSLEMAASVRTDTLVTGAPPAGSVKLYTLGFVPGGGFLGGSFATAPLPDTAFYSAPVVADLDRDGRLDMVVTSSNGRIYALAMDVDGEGQPLLEVMPGWPRDMFASGNDQVSIADIDGNGYPEVLAIETGGVFRIFNYHGESLVSLPETVPAEIRYFIEPQLAPLVSDLSADGTPEIVLPLDDGQVRGVSADGSRFGDWNYFGGGRGGASPALEDLDGDGYIELVTLSPWLDGARLDVHTIGRSTGAPAWGAHRGSSARGGLVLPTEGDPVEDGPTLADVFVMPNPAREHARVHYRVGAGVDDVTILIHDMLGRPVARLAGTTFAGSDNVVDWDLKGPDGRTVAPGVYLGRIAVGGPAGNGESTFKLAVLR